LREACAMFIPELAESDDERIGNVIYCIVRDNKEVRRILEGNGLSVDSALDYLEKQKEQKTVYEDEYQKMLADSYKCGKNEVIDNPEKYGLLKPAEIDEYEIIKKHITEDSLSGEVNKRLTECGWYVTEQKPVEWNNATINGEPIPTENQSVGIPLAEWSEDIIRKAVKEVGLTQHQIDWFKTNVFPPKQKWSEEDEIRLKEALEVLDESIKHLPIGYGFIEDVRLVKDWLKSIKERFNLEPKQEWNKKDKQIINKIIEHLSEFIYPKSLYGEDVKECIDWLKSLRTRPQ